MLAKSVMVTSIGDVGLQWNHHDWFNMISFILSTRVSSVNHGDVNSDYVIKRNLEAGETLSCSK